MIALFCFLEFLLSGTSLELRAQQVPPDRYIDSITKRTGHLTVSCGVDSWLKAERKSPEFLANEMKMNQEILETHGSNDTLTLPLVIHIVHPTLNSNFISDQQITDAIKGLNDAFSKSGKYAGSSGADAKIRFALARKTPEGGVTNGINRITSLMGNNMFRELEDGKLKNLMQWNPAKYINVWIVPRIIGEMNVYFQCEKGWNREQIGGYATFPGTRPEVDGIVMAGISDFLLTHEMGHYLGLYHTFENCCNNNDCTKDGDRVCDTPPDCKTAPSPSCSKPDNSCNTDTLSNYSNGFFRKDTTDYITNFMDYGHNNCANQFTQGQAERMRAAILSQRSGLMNDVLTPPCGENILVRFTRDKYYPITGETVNFTAGSGFSNYEWLINDNVVGSGSTFSYAFPNNGKFKVTLKASNNAGCFASHSENIQPNCGLTARFFSNKSLIASKQNILLDTIVFTNNTIGNATNYQWIINRNFADRKVVTSNVAGGGVNDLLYAFPQEGQYWVKLIASNANCADSTSYAFVNVLDPTPDMYTNIFGATCYQQTKLMFYLNVYNTGFATMKTKLPVSFYDADPQVANSGAKKIGTTFLVPDSITGYCGRTYQIFIDNAYPATKTLFAVCNDDGNQNIPIQIPYPGSPFLEMNYSRFNAVSVSDFRYTAKINQVPTQLPGDTILLMATTTPSYTFTQQYLWSPPTKLSCTNCNAPLFFSGLTSSTETKQLIVRSQWDCYDTTQVVIRIEATDFRIQILDMICAGRDSVDVKVKVTNFFTPGKIPVALPLAFFRNDPRVVGAELLTAGLTLPFSSAGNEETYTFRIRKPAEGSIYATLNQKPTVTPVRFPADQVREMSYTNNVSAPYVYQWPTRTETITACTGDTIYGRTVSGTYRDTLRQGSGCDSIRILLLTIRPERVSRTTVNTSICAGGQAEGYTQTGVYVDRFLGKNACDSFRTLVLTVNPNKKDTVRVGICSGERYRAGGGWQTTTGWYEDTLRTVAGCDSIVSTYLTVHPLPAAFLPKDTVLCSGKTLTLSLSGYPTVLWNTGSSANSLTVNRTGIYAARVTDNNGCSASDTVQVEFRYIVFDLFVNAACTGDTVLGRTSAGVYSDTFRTAGGCDSIRILHLSYRANPVSTSILVALCEGQQYAGYSRTGRYVDVFKAVNGCDSTRTLNLVVNPVYRQTREVQICDGSSYRAGGTLQTRSGIYYDTLRTRQGCDSVIVTQLSVTPLPVQFLPQDTTLCLGRTMSISLPQFRSTLWNSGSIDYNLLISAPGKYWVNVVDVNNCRGVDTIEVRYQRCIPIQVPNAFSPNGDYMNDVFRPVIPVVLKNYRMQIYSRLGYVIFETTDYRRGWDGKVNGILQNQGVYVYLIRFTDDDGKEVVKNGTLLLVR